MRRALAAAMVSWLLVLSANAHAQVEVGTPDDSTILIGGSTRERERDGPAAPAPSGPAQPTYPVVVLRNDPTVGVCVGTGRRPGVDNAARQAEFELQARTLLQTYPWCPGVAPTTLSPAMAAALAWQQLVRLQPPTVRIQPGKAIAGKPAYLEIGNPQTGSWHFNEYGYAIDLAATSTYDIDWGDGTWTRGATTQGGPWPGGTLRHAYTTAGTYTVTVYQRWSATYSINGETGTVPGTLQTVGTLGGFPVVEIEAVRNR